MADEPETVDASRRTHLANERTYLAWLRTGLTSIALAIGVGRLIPEIVGGTSWPWEALGTAFGVLGIVIVVYGIRRQIAVDRSLRQGRYASVGYAAVVLIGAFAALLGMIAIVLVVTE